MTCPFGAHHIEDWNTLIVGRTGRKWHCVVDPTGPRGTVCVRCHKTWRADGSACSQVRPQEVSTGVALP